MKYFINLFGHNMDCQLLMENGEFTIRFDSNEQKRFHEYLKRVLQKYNGLSPIADHSFEELIQQAIATESNLGGRLNEPTIKLPYEVTLEVKEKLVQAAAMQGISATQLLIRIVENKYEKMMKSSREV